RDSLPTGGAVRASHRNGDDADEARLAVLTGSAGCPIAHVLRHRHFARVEHAVSIGVEPDQHLFPPGCTRTGRGVADAHEAVYSRLAPCSGRALGTLRPRWTCCARHAIANVLGARDLAGIQHPVAVLVRSTEERD